MKSIHISILCTLTHVAFGWVGPRKVIGMHALTSSFLNEMKSELFQQQILQLLSSDSIIMIISSNLETKMYWTKNHHTLNYIFLAIVIYSCAEIYSTRPLKKLVALPAYVRMARQFKIVIATMFMVFFRAVENAI